MKQSLALFALIATSACALHNRPARSVPEFEARLESVRRDRNIPGMSAAISNGQHIVWSKGFGYADVEHSIPATDTTDYHLASLTKTFASTIIMQLVESGQLNLDAPVSDFGIVLPGPGTIRVKHLLTHTSEEDPGSRFLYNGNRFGLLDQVILKATGESFAQRVERIVIRPLNLTHTAPNVLDSRSFSLSGFDPVAFKRNLAQGYSSDGKTAIPYPETFGTAAGMISSAGEVARYSMAIDRNAFVKAGTQARAFTATVSTTGATLPYGDGWFVQTINGVRLQWHYGWWTGNSSLIIRVPDRQLTFVLLANSDGLSNGTRLGFGELMTSPAARAFLDAFVFGNATIPDQAIAN